MGQLIYCYGRDLVRYASGAETFIRAQAMSASKLGMKPELFVLARRPGRRDLGYVNVVRTRSVGSEMRSEYAVLQKHRLSPAIVRRLENEPGPHVIHSFGTWAIAAQNATDVLRAKGIDVFHVATCWELMGPHTRSKAHNQVVRSNPVKRARQAFLTKWVEHAMVPAEGKALRAADEVLLNYFDLEEHLHAEYGNDINTTILPYTTPAAFEPVDFDSSVPEAMSELAATDGPMIVCTSRQNPRKGVDVLIRAIAAVRDAGVSIRATIVSQGPLLDAHRALVRKLNLSDRVTMPGRVRDVRPYLAHADIFSLPSFAEGSGSMSVIEALQFGVPVVSSAVDGMVEDLNDEADSLMVPPGSVDELADALRRLALDPALRDRIGAGGRELFERRFSVAAATDALAGLYARYGLDVTPDSVPAA